MSATVDTNVLVYASDTGSPRHGRARELLADLAAGTALTTLFWPVLMGYLRIVTNPRIMREPLASHAALSNVHHLLEHPCIRAVGEAEGFWKVFRAAAEPAQPTGNLIPDAHLVALMHQYGVRDIWTHDRDFRKFDGIVLRDPFS
ncbi:MAG: TA system VapC family ribonuclease toxin [Carbonactinosporaceae bacterium]